MKIPKWNGSGSQSTYLFSLVCFLVGFAAITALSLGRIKYDDREGLGWNPVSKLPDGKFALSEFAIECIGFAVLGVSIALLTGIAFKNQATQLPTADFTVKSYDKELNLWK